VKTTNKRKFPRTVSASPACVLIAAVTIALTGASRSQETISKEEYAKRQKGLIAAIAAMEAEETRQSVADTQRKVAQGNDAALDAQMARSLEGGSKLASDSPTVAKAKTEIAARETRIRKGASAQVVAQLDAPPGGVPIKGNGPAPGAAPISAADRDKARNKKAPKSKQVEILSQGGCTFNSKANLVVFEKDVVVKHPQFDLVSVDDGFVSIVQR
jgi:hypothetical protein